MIPTKFGRTIGSGTNDFDHCHYFRSKIAISLYSYMLFKVAWSELHFVRHFVMGKCNSDHEPYIKFPAERPTVKCFTLSWLCSKKISSLV